MAGSRQDPTAQGRLSSGAAGLETTKTHLVTENYKTWTATKHELL